MTADRKDMSDVLRDMEEPITNIRRASDALDIIAVHVDMQQMHQNAIIFVAEALLELHKQLEAAHVEAVHVMWADNSQGPGSGPVAVSVAGRAER